MRAHKLLCTNTSEISREPCIVKIKCPNAYTSRRRGFRLFFVLAIWIAVLLARTSQPAIANSAVINDPLFSIDYDPRRAHFDSLLTKELLPECRKALSSFAPLPTALTLYAQYAANSTKIYIAGADDDIGIYVVRSGRCDAGIPILALLQRQHLPPEPGEAPALSNAEIGAVFNDALARYARAFGGKVQFLQWLDISTEEVRRQCKGPEKLCAPTYHSFPSELQNLLENYRKG